MSDDFILTLNDVRVGDCFRFVQAKQRGKVDNKPQYADTMANPRAPTDLSDGWDSMNMDDQVRYPEWWKEHGKDAVELLEHYSRATSPTQLTRGHILVWECFQYLETDQKFIMVPVAFLGLDVPDGWTTADIGRTSVAHRHVRRIPRWDEIGEWRGLPRATGKPVVLSHEPLVTATLHHAAPITVSELDFLMVKTAIDRDGKELTGEQCLARLERAMQTESLCREPGFSQAFVSTLGDEGLDHEQVELGLEVWRAKLAELRKKAEAEQKARMPSVVVDWEP